MSPRSPALQRLRQQADRVIAAAICHRLELASALGVAKSRQNAALRDFGVEERVLSRWQDRLASAGVLPARSMALARWLIEESLRVQESTPALPQSPRRTRAQVGVIGGAGGMGRWLDKFLTDAGNPVRIIDPQAGPESGRTLPSVEAAMDECDFVAFATPIRSTAPLMERAFAHPSRAVCSTC